MERCFSLGRVTVSRVPYDCPLCGAVVGADARSEACPDGRLPLCCAHPKDVALLAVLRARKQQRLQQKRWRVRCAQCRRFMRYADCPPDSDAVCKECR